MEKKHSLTELKTIVENYLWKLVSKTYWGTFGEHSGNLFGVPGEPAGGAGEPSGPRNQNQLSSLVRTL